VNALPDPGTDPAAYLLAVADLREQRAEAATGGGTWRLEESDGAHAIVLASSGSHESQYTEIEYTHGLYTEDGDQYETACLIAGHIAAEANPDHALKEVALWRAVVYEHEEFFRRLRAAGSTQPERPGVLLLCAVEAAKAYAGAP
jgi:hypothetical protein